MTTLLRKLIFAAAIVMCTLPTSGCRLFYYATKDLFILAEFWRTTPFIPVSPYLSQEIEDRVWENERYNYVPVLDPVEGENAPLFCIDPPSPDQIMRALPAQTSGGMAFLAETSWDNVNIQTELIVDRLDECKFFPLAGPARLKHCHWKCTVTYDETRRSYWPIPFTVNDPTVDVVYIDNDYLIRCAGPPTP